MAKVSSLTSRTLQRVISVVSLSLVCHIVSFEMSDKEKKTTSDDKVLDGSDQVAVRHAKLNGLRDLETIHSRLTAQTHVSKQAIGLLDQDEETGPESMCC